MRLLKERRGNDLREWLRDQGYDLDPDASIIDGLTSLLAQDEAAFELRSLLDKARRIASVQGVGAAKACLKGE